ncbi:MAG: hypothetical protein QM504_08620 [Pseudomonadota bacterium]
MNIVTRRKFLKSLISVVACTLIPGLKLRDDVKYSSEQKYALIKIYNIWLEKKLGDPYNHINSRTSELQASNNLDIKDLRGLSSQDFCDGALFEIDGLILSRFEASIMAYHGKLLV